MKISTKYFSKQYQIKFIFITCLFLSCISFSAKGVGISYILPDIGAPGMNTYIEIIGPVNGFGNFGKDGISLDNPGESVRIALDRPADSIKVTFGPIVISWNGRMLSTQIFVSEKVQPNSDNWNQLTTEFRIPFHVTLNGVPSNTDTFYIVKPFQFSDASGESILGEGNLGIRSRRGAMIVENMNLGTRQYTISKRDCELSTPNSNQGYLPFILLSKGSISGQGAATIINGDGAERHGGPGGGGGGGRFCDAWLLDQSPIGDDGGDGFVAGGPGGKNCTGCTNVYKQTGIGTGISGNSLNGVNAPFRGVAYEAAGGGSGHPFGTSGESCYNGDGCSPVGGFGGGSGYRQNTSGGSGGYVSKGAGTNPGSGGGANGNIMGVPLAGGSGAASGNPQAMSMCSGNGGGGGGAISIYSKLGVSSFKITANGGRGGASGYGPGGGGSGGFVHLQSNMNLTDVNINISGGLEGNGSVGGSAGRARADGDTAGNIGSTPAEGTFFRGISTDTSSYVKRKHKITGSRPDIALAYDKAAIYLKPESGNWRFISMVNNTSTNKWDYTLDLPAPDTIFYVVVALIINTPQTDTCAYEPPYIMSQAAANILNIIKSPEITGDSIIKKTAIDCPGFSQLDTAFITNTGNAPLIVEFNKASFALGNQGYFLVSPTSSSTISPGDTLKVIVRYTYQTGQSGIVRDTLLLPHNDNTSIHIPWRIVYETTINPISLKKWDKDNSIILGSTPDKQFKVNNNNKVCKGIIVSREFLVINESSIDLNILDPASDSSFCTVALTGAKLLHPGDTGKILVTVDTKNISGMMNFFRIFIKSQECPNKIDTVLSSIEVVYSENRFIGTAQFPQIRVGRCDTMIVKMKNNGTGSSYIDFVSTLNPPFKILTIKPQLPTYRSTGDEMEFTIEFCPTDTGTFCQSLSVKGSGDDKSCADSAKIDICGIGVLVNIYVSKDTINFGMHAKCDQSQDSVILQNNGSITINFTQKSVITGTDAVNFEIAQGEPQIPYALLPTKAITFFIKFYPDRGPAGDKNADLIITTDDPEKPMIKIHLTGNSEWLNVSTVPPGDVDAGGVPIGLTRNFSFILKNNGKFQQDISNIKSKNGEVTITPIIGSLTPNGGTITLTAGITPTSTSPTEAEIVVTLFSPCLDSIIIKIKYFGIEGNFDYSRTLDYGTLLPCKDSVASIFIRNLDPAPVRIDSMKITGSDAALFKFDDLTSYPVRLDSNQSHFRMIRFMPKNASNGTKDATVSVYFFSNNKYQQITIKLNGTRQDGLLIAPANADFGDVVINQTSSKTITLRNAGTYKITINNISQPTQPQIFSESSKPLPIQLNPGDTTLIIVTFKPELKIDYLDSLMLAISIDDTCKENISILLIGRGIQARAILLWVRDTTIIEPYVTEFRYPVYARIDSGQTDILSGFSLSFSIEIDSNIFLPFRTSSGTISRLGTNSGTYTVSISSATISNIELTITELIGPAILGDKESSTVTLYNPIWIPQPLITKIQTSDGIIISNICKEGGKRLLKPGSPAVLSVSPNPAGDATLLNIKVLETGEHRLELFDIHGNKKVLGEWSFPIDNSKELALPVDLSSYASGVYFIVLRTPARNITARLSIIR
ncbi:MAG: hypothetical protein HW421_2178 [Ignavibacteria bacterium]|nr:hypothetical protein [Ignavibacteria bacterium]